MGTGGRQSWHRGLTGSTGSGRVAQWVEFVKFSGAVRARVEPSLGSRLGCLCLFHKVRDVPFRDEVTSFVLSITIIFVDISLLCK